MASYLLEYICFHIYWNMASYLLEYGIIFIGIWHHIYWNMASYLLEYGIIFIGICCHIYWNMLSYLLEYVIIFIYCYLLNSNSDENYIQNITSVNLYEEYHQTTAKTLINKRKTKELLICIPEFCFIISQYSYGLNLFTC